MTSKRPVGRLRLKLSELFVYSSQQWTISSYS